MTEKRQKSNSEKLKSNLTFNGIHMEIDGVLNKIKAVIAGVVSIVEYSDEHTVVLTRKGRICIEGFALEMTILEQKQMEICGRITSIAFENKKRCSNDKT